MDININNETYGEAYKCLNEAYELVKNDLGNFNKLNKIALHLIDKNCGEDTNMLDKFYEDCQLLKSRMYETIELLSKVNNETAYYFKTFFDEELSDIFFSNDIEYGSKEYFDFIQNFALSGYNNGPSGSESWCSLDVSHIVENMEIRYGYADLKNSIREDGVRVLSGVDPDGQYFENLVIVISDVYHKVGNPGGTFSMGDIVDTSLGKGIVVDISSKAINERKNTGNIHFDVVTAWDEGEYRELYFGKRD